MNVEKVMVKVEGYIPSNIDIALMHCANLHHERSYSSSMVDTIELRAVFVYTQQERE